MNATRQFNNIDIQSKIAITTSELQFYVELWSIFCHTGLEKLPELKSNSENEYSGMSRK